MSLDNINTLKVGNAFVAVRVELRVISNLFAAIVVQGENPDMDMTVTLSYEQLREVVDAMDSLATDWKAQRVMAKMGK